MLPFWFSSGATGRRGSERLRTVGPAIAVVLLLMTSYAYAATWGVQNRTHYRPDPSGSNGKYASGAVWVRYDADNVANVWLQRVSLRGSLGGTCGSSAYYWYNKATTVRDANSFLKFSGSSTSHKTNCNATDGGAVVAYDMSQQNATGLLTIRIENVIKVDSPAFSIVAQLRVKNRKVEFLNGNTWQTVPVANTVP